MTMGKVKSITTFRVAWSWIILSKPNYRHFEVDKTLNKLAQSDIQPKFIVKFTNFEKIIEPTLRDNSSHN